MRSEHEIENDLKVQEMIWDYEREDLRSVILCQGTKNIIWKKWKARDQLRMMANSENCVKMTNMTSVGGELENRKRSSVSMIINNMERFEIMSSWYI